MPVYLIRDNRVSAPIIPPNKIPKDAILARSARDLENRLPMTRLVALWNALPGITPVTRFSNKKAATRRLWAAWGQIAPHPAAAPAAPGGRPASKQAQVIALLRRPAGATLDEMAAATGWQRHSVRGFLSGTIKKRFGPAFTSTLTERGRRYRIAEDGNRA